MSSDYFEYMAERAKPKPAHKMASPDVSRLPMTEPVRRGIEVEETTNFLDTCRMLALGFRKRL